MEIHQGYHETQEGSSPHGHRQSIYTLRIGGAASQPLTSMFAGSATYQFTIEKGGDLTLSAPTTGYTVTAGSADTLRVENTGPAPVEYDIFVEGVTV